MAHSMHMRSADGTHGALPVIAVLVGALLVALAALGYLAWTRAPGVSPPTFEMKLPKAPQMPPPTPLPNPQPLPLPKPG